MAQQTQLADYMQTYGDRLQSMLQGPTGVAPGTGPVGPTQGPVTSQLTQAQPTRGAPAVAQQAGPAMRTAQAMPGDEPSPEGQGKSFSDHWHEMSPDEQKQQVDSLEETLSRGNESIDSAYNELVRQLGTRPSGKLSREDKGMLLMEFGLSLMSASARGAHGDDLGGAIGAAGLQTLDRYQQLTRGRQQTYDSQVQSINAARSKSKSALAEKVTGEHIKATGALARDRQKNESELGRMAGTVTTEGGDVYGYTKGGKVSALQDPTTGKTLKGRERAPASEPLVSVLDESGNEVWMPRSQAVGKRKRPTASSGSGGMKASDTNAIYRQAAGLFGGMFDPMTGRIAGLNREQSEQVQSIASRASQLYLQSEGALDHASAVQRAFQELRSGQPGANSGPDSGPSIPADAPRRSVGGKSYVQVDGQWYEEG